MKTAKPIKIKPVDNKKGAPGRYIGAPAPENAAKVEVISIGDIIIASALKEVSAPCNSPC